MSDAVKTSLDEAGLIPLVTAALWKSLAVHISTSNNTIKEDQLVDVLVKKKDEIVSGFQSGGKEAQKNILKDIAKQEFQLKDAKEENANNDLPRASRNRDPWQRCMDRLARLLALGSKFSPCVAVAFNPNESLFYMACNTPVFKSDNTADQTREKIQELLMSKFEILKEVISVNHPTGEVLEEALKILTAENNHHQYGAQKPKDNKKYGDSIKRLRADLEKLVDFFDANPQMKTTFLSAVPNILIPQPSTNSASEHAEQMLAKERNWESRTAIGVNYLCCATCDEEISSKSELNVRGTHGVRFPRVGRSVTSGEVDNTVRGSATMSKDLEPTDSESDSEMEKVRKMQTPSKREKFRPAKLEVQGSSSNDSLMSTRSSSSPSFFQPSPSAPSPVLELRSPSMVLLDDLVLHVKGIAVNDNEHKESERSTFKKLSI